MSRVLTVPLSLARLRSFCYTEPYFPERYGAGVIRLALDLLARRPAPPAVFVKHQIVTSENVEHLYPNDALMGVEPYARF